MSSNDSSSLVSVVIETITCRYDAVTVGSMADDLTGTLGALERQTYPWAQIETIVVVDSAVAESASRELVRRFPFVRLASSTSVNYCAAKNAGAGAARGAVVALLDGDCEPHPEWLERLVARFEPGVDVVAGRTRYQTGTRRARIFSATDFGHVAARQADDASGFNINNVALRRDVFSAHPLDQRVRRNGGCTLLYHQLRAAGKRVVYEPRACVSHGDGDIRGLHFLRKHFGRGFDSVDVYLLDTDHVLRGSRLVQRFGAPALVGITIRRILLDWLFLARERRHLGIRTLAIPGVGAVGAFLRLIEFAGMITRAANPNHYPRTE